jgi:alkylated DNA nucleotide flippase Atl1
MASLSSDSAVPWQRIVSRWEKLSLGKDGNIDVEKHKTL